MLCALSDPPEAPRAAIFVETERGRVAVFQCAVDSSPPSTLVLRKGSEVVASSGSRTGVASPRIRVTTASNTMRVELRDVRPEDEGSYNLTATNALGSSARALYFRVQSKGSSLVAGRTLVGPREPLACC